MTSQEIFLFFSYPTFFCLVIIIILYVLDKPPSDTRQKKHFFSPYETSATFWKMLGRRPGVPRGQGLHLIHPVDARQPTKKKIEAVRRGLGAPGRHRPPQGDCRAEGRRRPRPETRRRPTKKKRDQNSRHEKRKKSQAFPPWRSCEMISII